MIVWVKVWPQKPTNCHLNNFNNSWPRLPFSPLLTDRERIEGFCISWIWLNLTCTAVRTYQFFSGPLYLRASLDGAVKSLLSDELPVDGWSVFSERRGHNQTLEHTATGISNQHVSTSKSISQCDLSGLMEDWAAESNVTSDSQTCLDQ